jgi:hypothetical protein
MITSAPRASRSMNGCAPAIPTMRSVASSSASVSAGRPSNPRIGLPARMFRRTRSWLTFE